MGRAAEAGFAALHRAGGEVDGATGPAIVDASRKPACVHVPSASVAKQKFRLNRMSGAMISRSAMRVTRPEQPGRGGCAGRSEGAWTGGLAYENYQIYL